MEQDKEYLEKFYDQDDPWNYHSTPDDQTRRERIIAALPQLAYQNTLDIGCGNGFITEKLPGKKVWGIDISENAIAAAKNAVKDERFEFLAGSIFELPEVGLPQMDLIVVTGVLYPQYIGKSLQLVNVILDSLLKSGGILLSSHVHEWYQSRFPYMTVSREWYQYRKFFQIMEVYCK
jgi:SAM-dependent methyltransferase